MTKLCAADIRLFIFSALGIKRNCSSAPSNGENPYVLNNHILFFFLDNLPETYTYALTQVRRPDLTYVFLSAYWAYTYTDTIADTNIWYETLTECRKFLPL